MSYTCPVCGWDKLEEDPLKCSYEICSQCGVEFGFESPELYPAIRTAWEAAGKPFWLTDQDWREKLTLIELSGGRCLSSVEVKPIG